MKTSVWLGLYYKEKMSYYRIHIQDFDSSEIKSNAYGVPPSNSKQRESWWLLLLLIIYWHIPTNMMQQKYVELTSKSILDPRNTLARDRMNIQDKADIRKPEKTQRGLNHSLLHSYAILKHIFSSFFHPVIASVKTIRPDHICQIQLRTSNLVPFFQRRPGSHCAKPAWVWSGWCGQVLAKHTGSGSKPVCKNNQAWFWLNASSPLQFLTFKFSSVFPQTAWIILCKTSPDLIWFWLTVSGLGQMDLVRKQASVPESLGPHLATASKPNRIWCELDLAHLLGYIVHGSNAGGANLLIHSTFNQNNAPRQ